MENRLVSTRLEMSSSWISVMQATVDGLLLMTQICLLLVGLPSIIIFFFFFFISSSLLDLFPFLFRVVHEADLFLGFLSNYLQNLPFGTVVIGFYIFSLLLIYIKMIYMISSTQWLRSDTNCK